MRRTLDVYGEVISDPNTFQFHPEPLDKCIDVPKDISQSQNAKSSYLLDDEFSKRNFATGDRYIHTQERCFLRFINHIFMENDCDPIDDLLELVQGPKMTKFCTLLAPPNVKFPKPTKPKQKIHQVQNMQSLIKFLEQEQKISLPGIRATSIVDGDKKFILSLIWSIIKKYLFKDLNWVDKTLVPWLKDTLKFYDNIVVKKLSGSFLTGLPFVALLHRFSPLFSFPSIVNDETNFTPPRLFEFAFSNAQKFLQIPRLLEPSDFQGVRKADSNSIALYLWFFYNYKEPSFEHGIRSSQPNSDQKTSTVVPARTEQVQLQLDILFEQQTALSSLEEENRELQDRITILHQQSQKLSRQVSDLESENRLLKSFLSPSDLQKFQEMRNTTNINVTSNIDNSADNTLIQQNVNVNQVSHQKTQSSSSKNSTLSHTSSTVNVVPDDSLSKDPTTELPEFDRSVKDNPNLSKLKTPPKGYSWIWIPEIKGAFMCPSDWQFRKKVHSQQHVDCLVSELDANSIANSRENTIVLINILKNHHLSSGISGKEYASTWISDLVSIVNSTEGMIFSNVNDSGMMNPPPFRNYSTLHVDQTQLPHIRVVNMILVNDVTNTVYIFAFRTPVSRWNKTWVLAQPILKQVAINKKI